MINSSINSSNSEKNSIISLNSLTFSSPEKDFKVNNFCSLDNKLQLYPIFLAVSNLSPVKTHIFIPADLNSIIVSGTLSCNLSSPTVPPIKVKLFSIIS